MINITVEMYSIRPEDVAGDATRCVINAWAARCADPRCIICENSFEMSAIGQFLTLVSKPDYVFVSAACEECVAKHGDAITDKAAALAGWCEISRRDFDEAELLGSRRQ